MATKAPKPDEATWHILSGVAHCAVDRVILCTRVEVPKSSPALDYAHKADGPSGLGIGKFICRTCQNLQYNRWANAY